MADLYLKALEAERKSLWAACRLKGLPKGTPERLRIEELDRQLAAHKAKGRLSGSNFPPHLRDFAIVMSAPMYLLWKL